MKVLHVGAFPFPTHQGSQVYVRGMAQALVRRGHEVVVASYAHGAGRVPRELAVIRSHRVPGGDFTASGLHWSKLLQDVLLVRTLRRALRRRQFDVVHAHNVEAPVLAWLARGLGRVPLVHNLHTLMGEELPTYTGGRGARLGRLLDDVVPRLCDGQVAISQRAYDHLTSYGPTVLVPPGIDLTELDGADASRACERWDLGDGPWVVYAGNADAYQDLPLLFEAMKHVHGAKFLVVTCDDVDVAGATVVRTTSWADTKDALALADVAVIPRTRCAGFPIKLLNQLGLGVPTVMSAGSAQPAPGVVSVPDHDVAAMAAAIQALVDDPTRRARLAIEAREGIAADWTWDAQAARLESFYASLSRSPTDW